MKVLIVYSGKGGVGKTTTTVNIAKALAKEGKKVYLIDGDVNTSSLPVLLGDEQQHCKHIRFNSIGINHKGFVFLQASMIKQFISNTIKDVKKYKPDYVLIDTPPSITDVHLNIIDKLKVSAVLMVTQPNALSFADVSRTSGFFKLNDIPVIGLVENMASPPFDDGIDLTTLGFESLARVPLGVEFANGSDLTPYSKVVEALYSLDDVVFENAKKAAIHDDSVTEDGIKSAMYAQQSKRNGSKLRMLRFHNLSTWDFVREELIDLEPLEGMHDEFLDVNTTDKIQRLLEAFEDNSEAYFMVTRHQSFGEMSLFSGEIGQATLITDAKTYYGVPRIEYQTKFGKAVLFPHEVIPQNLDEIQVLINSENYAVLTDHRYMPPKEIIQQVYDAFGSRVGAPENWETAFDNQMCSV
jgi:MinD-like ATPase involved in chromosome partitioning or flagellar assembly